MAEHSDSSGVNGDAEGGVVQEIFRMSAAGMNIGAITAYLNDRRGPGSADGKWHLTSVRKTLSKWPGGL